MAIVVAIVTDWAMGLSLITGSWVGNMPQMAFTSLPAMKVCTCANSTLLHFITIDTLCWHVFTALCNLMNSHLIKLYVFSLSYYISHNTCADWSAYHRRFYISIGKEVYVYLILVIWSSGSKISKWTVEMQHQFDWDRSMTVIKGATLSTPKNWLE